MNDRSAGSVLLIVVGVSLLVYSPFAAPQSGTFLTHDGSVSRSELPADANVVAYESLSPDTRERFDAALEKGEARFDEPIPDDLSESSYTYIHYADAYHKIGFESVDRPGLAHVLVTAGFGGLSLIAGVGVARHEWKKR